MKCSICGEKKGKRLGEVNSFEAIRCGSCATIYTVRPKAGKTDFDYSNYYEEENLNVPEFVYETYRNLIEGFEIHRGSNRFLDVGCGAGTLLKSAHELEWDAQGVDISEPAVQHLRKSGFEVYLGPLEDAGFEDDYFDVITCTEVIEHVQSPQLLLKEISRILSPKGMLWMTTPHASGISGRLMGADWSVVAPPEHLNLFSKNSLELSLKKAGFVDFDFELTGFNPFEAINTIFRRGGANALKPVSEVVVDKMENSEGADRVEKSYRLNKWFTEGRNKQKVKNAINNLLSRTRLGDTIKVKAFLRKR